MYNYFTKDLSEMQMLKDINMEGKEQPWRENKEKSLIYAESRRRLGHEKRYYRIKECGTYLEFKRYIEGNILKLSRANFCGDRLCPMCGWRRAKKIFGQTSKIMDRVLEDKEYRFIFLTLTCTNIEGYKLASSLDDLFYAFKKLMLKAKVKKVVKGWFRALEVTHDTNKYITYDMYYGNKEKHLKSRENYYLNKGLKVGDINPNFDMYHPHFHIILMVNKSYFSKSYLSQAEWASLWKESLKVNYNPKVYVQTFKVETKKTLSKSICESAKYTVKNNDYILPHDEEMTDKAVEILSSALANRRLVAFGGEFKKIHKELNLDDAENGDLVNTGNEEEMREDINYITERYNWHIGYNQYVKMEDSL